MRGQAWKVLLTHQRKPHFHRAHPLHDHQDYNHDRSLPEETPHAAPVRQGGAPSFLDNCDYRMILKVQPITDDSLTRQYLSDVEAELTDPTGAFAGKPLRIPMRGLAFSSACGWSLELLADGIRTPAVFRQGSSLCFFGNRIDAAAAPFISASNATQLRSNEQWQSRCLDRRSPGDYGFFN